MLPHWRRKHLMHIIYRSMGNIKRQSQINTHNKKKQPMSIRTWNFISLSKKQNATFSLCWRIAAIQKLIFSNWLGERSSTGRTDSFSKPLNEKKKTVKKNQVFPLPVTDKMYHTCQTRHTTPLASNIFTELLHVWLPPTYTLISTEDDWLRVEHAQWKLPVASIQWFYALLNMPDALISHFL